MFQYLYSIRTLHDIVRLRPDMQERCLKSYGHAIIDRLMYLSTSSYLHMLVSLIFIYILVILPSGT